MEVRKYDNDRGGGGEMTVVGSNDVVDNGVLTVGVPAPAILVESSADLASLPEYPAGTVAYTAGFKAMWQLNSDGDWVSVI